MAERKQVDWEGVERDYSAGLMSLREIAAKYGVSPALITRKKKENDWSQDLTEKIKIKAAAIEKSCVNADGVNAGVNAKRASDKEIIEANAQAIVSVKLGHRKDIARGRNLVARLFDELEQCTDNHELFEELGDLLRKENDRGVDKLNDIYQKVISLPQRIDGVKKLSEALKVLIDKERQAFDIQDKTLPPESGLSQLLKMVQGNAVSVTSGAPDFDDDDE